MHSKFQAMYQLNILQEQFLLTGEATTFLKNKELAL